MAKATDNQIKNTKEALASGRKLPDGVRINFGDSEPIQMSGPDTTGPVSLTGKTKVQLEQIAADESVEVTGASTNADIVAAIEAARSAT